MNISDFKLSLVFSYFHIDLLFSLRNFSHRFRSIVGRTFANRPTAITVSMINVKLLKFIKQSGIGNLSVTVNHFFRECSIFHTSSSQLKPLIKETNHAFKSITFVYCTFSDKDINLLEMFDKTIELSFVSCTITDQKMTLLTSLPNLCRLKVNQMEVPENFVEALPNSIYLCSITNLTRPLFSASSFSPAIVSLELQNNGLKFVELSKFISLRYLDLSHNDLHPDSFIELKNLRKLKVLVLNTVGLKDLTPIVRCKQINRLSLRSNPISDGEQELSYLYALTYLDISYCNNNKSLIEATTKLANLHELVCAKMPVSVLALAQIGSLRVLAVENCGLKEVDGLVDLKLYQLNVANNPLDQEGLKALGNSKIRRVLVDREMVEQNGLTKVLKMSKRIIVK